MRAPSTHWQGESGQSYKYWIHKIGTSFRDEPGNYIFANESGSGAWIALYIGQSESLAERLADHGKEKCATHNGATHVHAHTSSRIDLNRTDEERDLIRRWDPVCNE